MKLYPDDTATRFEFPIVAGWIADRCQGQRAKEIAADISPSDIPDQIELWLDQSLEAKTVLINGVFFPEYSVPSLHRELSKLGIENAVLEGQEVMKIKRVAEVAGTVIHFLADKKEVYPALRIITEGIHASKELVKLIEEILEQNGFIRTSASKELGLARKGLADARQRANRAFETALRKYKKLGWLREYDESFYNERRVLAVVAEYKRQLEGTLHGSSESGSTAFIEPTELVVLNNEVAEARQREQREEYRILKALTERIRPFKPLLEAYEYALGFLDFTFAKGKLALELDAHKPSINREKDIVLIDARHPILYMQYKQEGRKTQPLTLDLNHEKRILIISGPNAGGKSISLKTLGLLQIMFQSGVLIPAADHSRMGIFKQIFVDIGDDQSIAYELSTYSSRLQKMKHFLMQAHKNTLFFIDEFGTGSDPELGGAIAEAILEELAETRACGVITTHYANIKILAENHPHLVNGCMLFDEETLAPKYVLHIGHAGSSYTFEVAQKIGLPKELIEKAKGKLDQRKVKLDRLLITLQTKKNQLNKETSIMQLEKSNLRKELEQFKVESELYRKKSDDLNFSANKRLIEKGKKYEALLESWKMKSERKEISSKLTLMAEKEASRKSDVQAVEKRKERQQEIDERRKRNEAKGRSGDQPASFKAGDKVKLRSSRQEGVVDDVNKGKVTVVFGMIKTIVVAGKLEHV